MSKHKAVSGDKPVKLLKKGDMFLPYLVNYMNETINNNEFPDLLKLFLVVPVYKRSNQNDKENRKSGSILLLLSDFFEQAA